MIAHSDAGSLVPRLPPAITVDPIDGNTCRVSVGSDSPEMLAVYLGMLGVDFEIENPQDRPELVRHLRQLAGRYRRAARGRRQPMH